MSHFWYALDKETGEVTTFNTSEDYACYLASIGGDSSAEFRKSRRIGMEELGDFTVSTVFLGIDHRSDRSVGEPILFETMVFRNGAEYAGFTQRYCSLAAAEQGHKETFMAVKAMWEARVKK